MRLCFPEVENVFTFDGSFVNSLIIENQRLFRDFVYDLYGLSWGNDGKTVLSVDFSPAVFHKKAELITDFLSFDINSKTVISRVQSVLEKSAVSSENYLYTQKILADNENWLSEIGSALPFDTEVTKLSVSNLLKSFGVIVRDDSESLTEKLINYMEIIRELDSDKLFIFVGLRSYITDKEAESFFDTAVKHRYKIFLIDSSEHNIIKNEKRTVIDKDLCEF